MSTHRRLVAAVPARVEPAAGRPAADRRCAAPGRRRGLPRPARVQPAGEAYRQVLGASAAPRTCPAACRRCRHQLPADVTGATEGVLGAGRVLLGGTEVVATRILDTTVPRVPGAVVDASARLLEDLLADRLSSVRAELPAAALGELASGGPACVPALAGPGQRTDPVGDDVLCGSLATALAVHVRGPAALRRRRTPARADGDHRPVRHAARLRGARRGAARVPPAGARPRRPHRTRRRPSDGRPRRRPPARRPHLRRRAPARRHAALRHLASRSLTR